MPRPFWIKFSLGILSIVWILSIGIPEATSLSYYQRGPKRKEHPHSKNRYTPHLPPHLARQQAQQKPPCKALGQARCLGPEHNKKINQDLLTIYSRSIRNGLLRNKSVHPYLKSIIAPRRVRVY